MIPGWTLATSPFHRGEKAVHDRLGIHASIETRVRRAGIRNYMPDQYREFFAMLPLLLIGRLDADGQPWATLRTGQPGFINTPDAHSLRIAGASLAGDPVGAFKVEDAVGTLGIQPYSGRRNRANGFLTAVDADAITLAVNQSYGNCNKYIQGRTMEWKASREHRAVTVTESAELSDSDAQLVQSSDTFFVASAYLGMDAGVARGVDISHKGGWPGFVRVDDARTLTVPDFVGNAYFNTLGNLTLNPLAGLLFVDFASGSLLYLAAHADILWDDPQIASFKGAQRLLRFRITHVHRTLAALPFRWSEADYSPALQNTGVWGPRKARVQPGMHDAPHATDARAQVCIRRPAITAPTETP